MPPVFGNILMRQQRNFGNKIYESMRREIIIDARHADLTMATRYVQDVSAQTDRVIENSRKYMVREKSCVVH